MNYKYSILLILTITALFGCKNKFQATNSLGDKSNYLKDSLAFELCKIYGFDQGIRDFNINFDRREIMPKVDTLNFNRIVSFLTQNGYPTQDLLGEKNMEHECVGAAFTAVLLHNPHRLVNEQKYFDLFLNEVRKGNLEPDFYATILDKYYWAKSTNKETRRVFYGSQFGKPCIQTKEATNKARVEIGLKPLEDSGFVDCDGEKLDMPKERR